MKPIDYIKLPYSRVIVPDEDGGYFIHILEFQGCLSQGETLLEAMINIEDAMESWIGATLDMGQSIPEPLQCKDGIILGISIPHKEFVRASIRSNNLGLSLEEHILNIIKIDNKTERN